MKKWYQKTWVKVLGALVLIGFIGNAIWGGKSNSAEVTKTEEPSTFNILNIANMPLDSVEKHLGAATKMEDVSPSNTPCPPCPKYSFQNGGIEIVFINGVADWITIKNLNAKYSNCSIDELGPFDCTNRTFKSDVQMRWENIRGIKVITLFQKFDNQKPTFKVDYAIIKVNNL